MQRREVRVRVQVILDIFMWSLLLAYAFIVPLCFKMYCDLLMQIGAVVLVLRLCVGQDRFFWPTLYLAFLLVNWAIDLNAGESIEYWNVGSFIITPVFVYGTSVILKMKRRGKNVDIHV